MTGANPAGDAGQAGTNGNSTHKPAAFDIAKEMLRPDVEKYGDGELQDYEVLARADEVAALCKVRKNDLRAWARDEMKRLKAKPAGQSAEAAEPQRTRPELENAAARLLAAPDMLSVLRGDLPALRIAGVGVVVLGTYVAAQSRRWLKPIHAAVAGPSGTGKSYEADAALSLISPADIYRIGDGSEKFIVYDTTPLAGRVVYFVEATPLQRDSNSPLAYATRTLMSEGVARYRFVDFEAKDSKGRPTAQEIVRHGPAAVIVTSTADKLHTEIETRLVRFVVDGGAAQTARILGAMAQDLDAPPPDVLIEEWRAFDELLTRFGTIAVAVPFADACVKALEQKAATMGKPLASRLRRDFKHVLTAVQTIAFINQHHRQRDTNGRVVAEATDWHWASALLDPSLNRGSLRALPQSAHTVFAELAKRSAAVPKSPHHALTSQARNPVLDVPTRQLAVDCGMEQTTAARALRLLVDAGCIQEPEVHIRQRGGQYQIVSAPSLQTGRQVLPTWAEITAAAAPPATPVPPADAGIAPGPAPSSPASPIPPAAPPSAGPEVP